MTDPTVHLERSYDVGIAEVWSAWTDPERLSRWMGSVSGAPLDGDLVTVTMGDEPHERARMKVIAADPPYSLELAWTFAGEHESVLTLTLTAETDTSTRLILEHRNLGPVIEGYVLGWTVYLDGELAAELGGATPAGTWDERFALARSRAAD